MPTRSCKDMREAQLKDDNLKKIIDSFESPLKTEEYANWTERGFLMNQGVLYRYVPDADSAEAQLVIPTAERELIMERHHNDPMAGHYGEEGTFQKIARLYYWTGMRKYISDYIKKCPECARFKATNQKPAGLLRTPVYSQRFEVIAIDLFGPLPQTDTDDVVQDFKSVVHNDNFVAEITPYLKTICNYYRRHTERIETKQDQRKMQYDKNRRPVYYSPGDKVWVTLHPISSAKNKKTSKFMPKRDGPYLILTQKSPTSYVIASLYNPSEPIATYHTSALTPVKT
ncbi:transposon Tf2-6 polyprotein [Trichonephila clavipes]|nr:transposon Tf2-6 polyprotein [Trichonephila clavipes]